MLQAGRSWVRGPMSLLIFSNLRNPSNSLGPEVFSASNRNEYQNGEKIVSG
jgi:hypothetical protein